tara:strand:- start:235 stop:915 length:681 start_codon:yes stop_codon:yes gene_type:complete
MSDISFNKLGGQCLIAGSIISFIAFFLQIFLGGPPPDNVNIFSHFANISAEGGSLNILYNMMGVFGTILIMHGISNLNGFLQEKQTDPLLGFGTFLFLVGQFLIIIAWSIDPAITIGRETADIGDMAIRQMSMFMLVTPVAFLGGTIISIVLSNRKFASPIYMKISALIFVIVIVLALYTLFKLADTSTHNSGSTIIPLFACFSIAQLVWFIWNIMVGSKMIKGNH